MRITRQDIEHVNNRIKATNKDIDKENNKKKYNSPEEKQFTLGACVGLFSLWKPLSGDQRAGLPPEISCIIGDELSREDARNIALTCKKANTTGKANRDAFIEEHGKSYEEVPHEEYCSYMFLPI